MAEIDFSKVTLKHTIIIILGPFAFLVSPLWYLYQFANNIFQKMDFIKLVVMALAIGLPIFVSMFCLYLMSLVIANNSDWKEPTDNTFFIGFLISSLATALILYSPSITLSIFSFNHFTLNEAIKGSKASAFGVLCYFLISGIVIRIKK